MVMFRLFEPDRPARAQDLPRYDRADYWHVMHRAVRRLSDDVVELPRFPDMRIRALGYVLFLFTLAIMIVAPIVSYGSWGAFQADLVESFRYVFFFEEDVREQYREYVSRGTDLGVSEDAFVREMLDSPIHQNRFFSELFGLTILWSIPLGCILAALFWPRACAVRFDRALGVGYTWHKGQFLVAEIGRGAFGRVASEGDGNPLYFMDKSTGPFEVRMHPPGDPTSGAQIRMGPYPVCHAHQNRDISMFLQAFMSDHLQDADGRQVPWDDTWLDKIERGRFFPYDPLRALARRTLGPKRDFDEDRTRRALDALTH